MPGRQPFREPAIALHAAEFSGGFRSGAEAAAALQLLLDLAANAVPCDAERIGEFLIVRGQQTRQDADLVRWQLSVSGSRSGRHFCTLDLRAPAVPSGWTVAEYARCLQQALNERWRPEASDEQPAGREGWRCSACGELFAHREHWLEHTERWHRRQPRRWPR